MASHQVVKVSSKEHDDTLKEQQPKGSDKDFGHESPPGYANEEISPAILHGRIEAAGIDSVYERKVYIVNRVIDEHIGMGKFQWGLFMCCGFGWMADNWWLQGVAIILPQIKPEFGVEHAQWMTFALYVGLILGAFTWGFLADVIGRKLSFNITLALAGLFGIAGGGAPNFVALGGLLAALGFGLGGSLPVDGMLFLEFVPGSGQYLLTLLSVFWSFGQLVASLIAWAFIANYSCSATETNLASTRAANPDVTYTACLKDNNMGWRYTFYTFGALTFALFILRFFIFRLPESPKFLVAKGRDHEAVEVLRYVASRNGVTLGDDVISVEILRTAAGQDASMDVVTEDEKTTGLAAIAVNTKRSIAALKPTSLKPNMSHVTPLFASVRMGYNTAIIFLLWTMIGLAYPLYNAFLPSLLSNLFANASTYQTYRDYAIISACGVPGSFIAAWLVDLPRSGRRGAMALGTLLTGVFLIASTTTSNEGAYLGWNAATALTQQIMYGVLYSYTPESFPAPHRGTGDGIASSLNRVAGLMAPIISIFAPKDQPNVPLYVAGALFIVAALLMLTLRVETAGRTAL